MSKLNLSQAEQLLLSYVESDNFGDWVYEFAQELCNNAIREIESNNQIYDADGELYTDNDGSDTMWYDNCREDFMKAVFERLESQDW